MRLIRISLSVKYRILFGCAVLLIVGAALYVPWNLMEALVLEQPFREAQRMADEHFRRVLGSPDRTGDVHGRDVGLLSLDDARPPTFIPFTPKLDDEDSIVNQFGDDFLATAFRRFLRQPSREYYYASRIEPDGRHFRYAHSVRATKSCMTCHDEARSARRVFRENELVGMIAVDVPTRQLEEQLLANRLAMFAAGGLAGILAILVFYVIVQRFILSPIEELREVALRVTEGDLTVRSAVDTGDEFQQLSDTLNTMLERLRASQDELRKANKLLDVKLGEMAETNVSLYEANRVKGEFLANVTHELRTPLTSIIGFAELLRDAPPTADGAKTNRYIENILISGRILLEIINDLLDLAKIEAGKVELKLVTVRVDEACSALLDFMRPLADKKNLTLTFEADENLPILITDRGRLRQILFNLLSNAIKFTPEGGRVMVFARREAEFVRLSVQDTGPGIDPEHQAMIFDKFRQIDASTTREHAGTGLGLAISKELTSLLGGQIGVVSEPGKGATFWVLLPHAAPDPAPRPLPSLV
ncbi:MAG: hypothetical protein AMXMBFR47_36880 [Planctomycetota bacterium]